MKKVLVISTEFRRSRRFAEKIIEDRKEEILEASYMDNIETEDTNYLMCSTNNLESKRGLDVDEVLIDMEVEINNELNDVVEPLILNSDLNFPVKLI